VCPYTADRDGSRSHILTPEVVTGKPSTLIDGTLFCGIDVSAKSLTVAVQRKERKMEQRTFANSANGHRSLVTWLQRWKMRVRVTLEATGVYSLDLSMTLNVADGIELAVLNPKATNRFAQTIRRSKTDAADAEVLAEYSRRMPFTSWCAPNPKGLRLRTISRYIDSLTVQNAIGMNRLHAAEGSVSTPRCVIQDLKSSLVSTELRIRKLRREAMAVVREDDELRQQYGLLTSIPGIAQISAIQLLGELCTLSPDMTVRELVAHSGLDPAHEVSGTSVRKQSRISRAGNRHLRRALYMPALVGSRCDPHMKAFYETLITRHKTRLQALVAVARKLLHAIYGVLRSTTPYDAGKLFPIIHPCA
jgi:transposase